MRRELAMLRRKTGLADGVLTAVGTIGGCKAVVSVMDSRFLMGSMGAALGESITQAVEYAQKHKLLSLIHILTRRDFPFAAAPPAAGGPEQPAAETGGPTRRPR